MLYLYRYISYSFIKLYKTIYRGSQDISHYMGNVMFISSIFFWALFVKLKFYEISFLEKSFVNFFLYLGSIVILTLITEYINKMFVFKNKSPNEIRNESDNYSLIPAAIFIISGIIALIIESS